MKYEQKTKKQINESLSEWVKVRNKMQKVSNLFIYITEYLHSKLNLLLTRVVNYECFRLLESYCQSVSQSPTNTTVSYIFQKKKKKKKIKTDI